MLHNCLQSITSSRNDIGHFEQLDFSFNKLTQIPKLSYLYELSDYDLSHNNIETVSKTDFDITKDVKFLNLSHNHLRSLPRDVLNDLYWLRELDLSRNFISDLPENFIDENKKFEKFHMSYNELTKLPKFIFSRSNKLEVINLSHNRIKHVDLTFGSHSTLKVLRLDSNDIIEFNIDGYEFQNNPKIILSHNNIFHVNLTQIHFDLSYNPFVCDCKLNKFVKYLKRSQTELIFHDENYICSSPSNLNGTSLVSIDENLSCNYSKNCPKSCHCTIDDIDNIAFVSIDCANSNLTHFPNIASYGSSSVDIQLDLSRNAISSLPSKSHPMWTRIKKLDLSHNRIDSLENMTDLSILTTLYLNDNSFREFDPRQLQVGRVKLANNPIDDNLSCNYSKNCPKSCHCTIDDIDNIAFVSIDCANSNLTHFPNIASYGSSSVDIQLDLSRNAISSLPSKSHPMWTRIKKLDLSHNRIDSLENMTDLSILTTLYLNDNSFREFDPRQLQVGRVKLANNPWECNCEMSKLVLKSSSIEDKNRMTC
uniref:LRRCT domain-containing protein n=1 Tax=Strigamia maritima TaxID=126957 RepID=T1JL43_STRMM